MEDDMATHGRTESDSTKYDSPPESRFLPSPPPEYLPADNEDGQRRLVLCFDGTGDQFDSDNSNVEQFFSILQKHNKRKQMVYYQAGIGTYTVPEIATPFMSQISKALDVAIASHLDAHVMGGYEFLMQNYEAGDRICILGFSRGAYTARSLAGMIHKVGIIPTCNHQQVPFAYRMYTRADDLGWKQSTAFKKAFSIDVDIEFLGVWDTVSSVGIIPHRLPFTASNTIVRTFRHAVSVDERRAKFKANLWNRPNKAEQQLGFHKNHSHHLRHVNANNNTKIHNNSLKDKERQYSVGEANTDVDEVWFAGCHCDVGGGSHVNGIPYSLARIPLRWMIRECFKTGTGILFSIEGLREVGLDPEHLYPGYKRPPPRAVQPHDYIEQIPAVPITTAVYDPMMTEEDHELFDALSPLYDQLSLAWAWWILELMPVRERIQQKNDSWKKETVINMGRMRSIPGEHKVRVHRSVKLRLEAMYRDGSKYEPENLKKLLEQDRVVWVD